MDTDRKRPWDGIISEEEQRPTREVLARLHGIADTAARATPAPVA